MGEHSLAHAHYGSPLPCVVTSLKRLKASSSSRGPAHGIGTLANEASDIMGRGLGGQFLYLHFFVVPSCCFPLIPTESSVHDLALNVFVSNEK